MGGMSQSDFWASCGSTPNTVGLWVPKTGLRVQGPIKACRGSGTQNHLLWYSNNGPATVEGPQTIRKCLYTRPLCTQYKPSQKHPPFPTLHHSTQHPTTPTFAHTSQTCWWTFSVFHRPRTEREFVSPWVNMSSFTSWEQSLLYPQVQTQNRFHGDLTYWVAHIWYMYGCCVVFNWPGGRLDTSHVHMCVVFTPYKPNIFQHMVRHSVSSVLKISSPRFVAIDCPYQYDEGNTNHSLQRERLRREDAKSWTFVSKPM
jgi:hypothetical protein